MSEGEAPKEREKDGMSLNDMKKRAALMIEYISKAQVDLAGERTPTTTNAVAVEGGPVHLPDATTAQTLQDNFDDMTSREMMDVLTRQIMAWQKEYSDPSTALSAI